MHAKASEPLRSLDMVDCNRDNNGEGKKSWRNAEVELIGLP